MRGNGKKGKKRSHVGIAFVRSLSRMHNLFFHFQVQCFFIPHKNLKYIFPPFFIRCEWKITVAEGQRVKLQFPAFQVREDDVDSKIDSLSDPNSNMTTH